MQKKYGSDLNEIIFIQNPGETVFVPGGWWHSVLNLDDTIAVTQNYCNSVNFDKVWKSVRKDRKKMSVHFLKKLEKSKSEFAEHAKELNRIDNFTMYEKESTLIGKKRNKSKKSRYKTRSKLNQSSSSSSSSSSISSSSSSSSPSSSD